jgi:Carbohydrate-selective porin, OprB family
VLDADYRAFVRPNWPTRSFEGLLTAVYQYQIRDGWTVQPNFQYIIHPGGQRLGVPFALLHPAVSAMARGREVARKRIGFWSADDPEILERSIHDRRGAGCGMSSRPSHSKERNSPSAMRLASGEEFAGDTRKVPGGRAGAGGRRRATQCRGHVAAGSARTRSQDDRDFRKTCSQLWQRQRRASRRKAPASPPSL